MNQSTPCDFRDAGVLGAEATADYCYSHQAFCEEQPKPKTIWAIGLTRTERAIVHVAASERPSIDRELREELTDLVERASWVGWSDGEVEVDGVFGAGEVPTTHDGYLDLEADEWVDLCPDE